MYNKYGVRAFYMKHFKSNINIVQRQVGIFCCYIKIDKTYWTYSNDTTLIVNLIWNCFETKDSLTFFPCQKKPLFFPDLFLSIYPLPKFAKT